jgi:Uma2 family endonuclease
VSFSSPQIDRGVKAALYARADVPIYWLVDVLGKAVEVRTSPGPEGYDGFQVYGLGKTVPSPAAGVADLDVSALLKGLQHG